MKKNYLFALLISCQVFFLIQNGQAKSQLSESRSEIEPSIQNKYTHSKSSNVTSRELLQASKQNYSSGNFTDAERFSRESIEKLQEEYSLQPNFSIPRPGGVQERRISIPFIFEYYSTRTVPSEVSKLDANREISFNSLFGEVVSQISANPSNFDLTFFQTQIFNRFGGCLFFGNGGRSCTNFPGSGGLFEVNPELRSLIENNPELRSLVENDPRLREQFSVETNPESTYSDQGINNREDLHSTLQDALEIIQKSLIAQNVETKAIEALVFSEMARNTEFVRLAPLVLFGLLNYDAIISNPSYARFFGAINSLSLDLNSIRAIASREKATIVYYSTLLADSEKSLLVWVVQPSGNISFKEVNLSSLESSLDSLVSRGFTAAASFIDRGQQETALIQAVRSLRSQNYEEERASLGDFLVEESVQIDRLRALYKVLLEPIEELLPTDPNSHVIFVPHKSLTAVPFAALQDSEGRYVVEKHTIRIAPSLSNLRNPTDPIREMPTGNEFLAVGNPDLQNLDLRYSDGSRVNLANLPSANAEVVDVSPFDGNWFRQSAATRQRINPWLKDAKIIHLATHGILNFDNRKEFMLVQRIEEGRNRSFHIEQSRANIQAASNFTYNLWFNQVNSDLSWQVVSANLNLPGAIVLGDSVLTSEQILSLQLNADLVVLSACNSGRGVPTESGILGLPFALGLAGVPRVVVSQWSVPDASTRLLMINYYNAMRENIRLHGDANPAGALRKAMLETKELDYYRDPIYWAGFTTMDVSY